MSIPNIEELMFSLKMKFTEICGDYEYLKNKLEYQRLADYIELENRIIKRFGAYKHLIDKDVDLTVTLQVKGEPKEKKLYLSKTFPHKYSSIYMLNGEFNRAYYCFLEYIIKEKMKNESG